MKPHAFLLSIGLVAATGTAMAGGKWNISKLDASKLPPDSATNGLTFDKDIEPILDASCTRCHGEDRTKGNLRLDSLKGVLKGGKDGKVVVAGSSVKSLIVLAISRQDDATAMPPKFKGSPAGPGGPAGPPPPGGGAPPPAGSPGGLGGPPPSGPDAGGPPSGGPDGPPHGGSGGPPPGGPGGPGGPPGGAHRPKALTPEQIGLIRAWIDQGAK